MRFTESDIEPYVRMLITAHCFQGTDYLPDGFNRRAAHEEFLISAASGVLGTYSYNGDISEIVRDLMDQAIEAECFKIEDDRIAGTYYSRDNRALVQFGTKRLSGDAIYKRFQSIGEPFLQDVFSAYHSNFDPLVDRKIPGIDVPASDRIVSVDHNSAEAIVKPLNELIKDLEVNNGLENSPYARERLLGQLRAGRELINVGTFKAYLLYHTLLKGLAELVERYAGTAISTTAQTLLGMLIERWFST